MNPPGPVSEKHQIDALFSVGYEFQNSGCYHKAIGAYREVIRRNPDYASAYNNLGNCLRSLGKNFEALEFYNKALSLEPEKGSALLNKSIALLSLGRYEEAWPLYRHRLPTISHRSEVLHCDKPEWDGSSLSDGETLFLYSNQGLGDELQTLRYLNLVTNRVKNIIWEVQKPNYELFKNVPGINQVVVRQNGVNGALPGFDFHCEMFSLPEIFGTNFENVPPPWRPPFAPDHDIKCRVTEERTKFPDHKHIGLVWSGNPKNDLNRYRACGLVHYLPLLQQTNCRFYSLQKGSPRNDIEKFKNQIPGNLIDLADCLPNMASTATAIDELDFVITTDTSIPHLAGTIGAEAWVVLHQPSDWRWTLDKETTPWYPQLKLFRMDRPGTWKSVIDRVIEQIATT